MAYLDEKPSACCCCCCLANYCENHILKYICRTPAECGILTATLNDFGPRPVGEFVSSLLRLLLAATESEAHIEYQGFALNVVFEEQLPYAVHY
jgi:hypothetical protein